MRAASDATQAIDALHSISPDLPRDDWVRAGMASHAAGLDFDTFDRWSSGADSYNPRDARDTWKSFKPGKGIGPGSLFHIAKENGWRPGAGSVPPVQPARKLAAPPIKPEQGKAPAEVWARCEAATDAHGYIQSKGAVGVPLDTLRVLPVGDGLRINGHAMAGALVVPGYAPDGALQSLQLIPPTNPKMNLARAPMAGASFTVGELVPGGVAYVCEGIGAAWACWQATGAAAVVCFGWQNVARVAADLRQRDASARLVVVPDVGKEADAEKIARDVGAAVAYMPEGEERNFDANDLAQRDGADVLADLLDRASEPAKPVPLLKPVSVFDVLTNPSPPPAFVWDGYVPRGVVTLWGAHGGVGKSTIALMLAVAAATGRPLFGVPTAQCSAVFVSLEDGASIVRHRLAGICRAWGIDPMMLRDRLHIVDGTENPELFAADNSRSSGDVTSAYIELERLVQSTGAGLVVVDNASDAFGADEINRRQVRGFMRSLGQVARLTDCAVALLAHVDKGTSRQGKAENGEGYSGSTAWHNSARSRLFMTRANDGLLTLEHQKCNLGKRCEPITLVWPEGGLPMLATDAPDYSALDGQGQGRADDSAAAALLVLLAEFEGRGQYCNTAVNSRTHPYVLLKSEPAFQRLKLRQDDVKRIVTQCQRAGWIEPLEYRTPDRKPHVRWTVTASGRSFSGLPAPSAPSAPSGIDGASLHMAQVGAPSAPSGVGGMGDRARTQLGAKTQQKAAEKQSTKDQKP